MIKKGSYPCRHFHLPRAHQHRGLKPNHCFQLPRLPPVNHWNQFVNACRGTDTTSANFDYAGPLTEAVLLGGVAARFPQKTLGWDISTLKFDHAPANQYVRRPYRKGWEVKGL